jgi:tetratricopeptide (TPR) repeat protein
VGLVLFVPRERSFQSLIRSDGRFLLLAESSCSLRTDTKTLSRSLTEPSRSRTPGPSSPRLHFPLASFLLGLAHPLIPSSAPSCLPSFPSIPILPLPLFLQIRTDRHKNVLPMVNKANCLLRWKEDFTTASSLIESALAIDPQCDVAVVTLAQLSLQQGKLDKAIEMFGRAKEIARTEEELVQAVRTSCPTSLCRSPTSRFGDDELNVDALCPLFRCSDDFLLRHQSSTGLREELPPTAYQDYPDDGADGRVSKGHPNPVAVSCPSFPIRSSSNRRPFVTIYFHISLLVSSRVFPPLLPPSSPFHDCIHFSLPCVSIDRLAKRADQAAREQKGKKWGILGYDKIVRSAVDFVAVTGGERKGLKG